MATDVQKYVVYVDENSSYMDEDARWKLDEFNTFEEAKAAATRRVELCLEEQYEDGMTADMLFARYKMFGEDAWISSGGFSAWEYAQQRCQEMCTIKG